MAKVPKWQVSKYPGGESEPMGEGPRRGPPRRAVQQGWQPKGQADETLRLRKENPEQSRKWISRSDNISDGRDS